MRDKSGAQRAPTGSGLGITPADSSGTAPQQRAPGHDRPPAAPRAAGHGRLSAASGAPGPDVPLATTAGAPGHDRLSAVQQAPGPDVPLATTARAPRHDRLSAAHLVPDHNRSGAALAAASVPDRSHVSPPPAPASRPLPSRYPSPPGHRQPPSPTPPHWRKPCTTGCSPRMRCRRLCKRPPRQRSMPRSVYSRSSFGGSWPWAPTRARTPRPAARRRRPAPAAHRAATTDRRHRPRRRRVAAPAQDAAGPRQGLPVAAV